MSERKKLKVEQQDKNSKELLEKLQSLKNNKESAINTPEYYEQALMDGIDYLKDKRTEVSGIHIIAAVESIYYIELTEEQLDYIHTSLLEILQTKVIDLGQFIASGVVKQMRNVDNLIESYLQVFNKVNINKEWIKQLTILLVEQSDQKAKHIQFFLSKYEKYKDLVLKVVHLIDFDGISEDLYIQLFSDSAWVRSNIAMRIVRGRKRMSFIEKAIEINGDFVFKNYLNDRDRTIRLLLANKIAKEYEKPEHQKYFDIMINDIDEEIRCTLLAKLTWERTTPVVADRLLDVSKKVREISYEIYKKGLLFCQSLRGLNMFDESVYKQHMFNGKLSFNDQPTISVEMQDKAISLFENFVSKLAEGCLTMFVDEYLKLLKDSAFSLDFLCEHANLQGMSVFLKTLTVNNLKTVPLHVKAVVLKYMYKGTLTNVEIHECIQANIFEVLKFIPDINIFINELIEKTLTLTDIYIVEEIVEHIKHSISNRCPIYNLHDENKGDIVNDSGMFSILPENPKSFDQMNLYLINAHTNTSELFNEQQLVYKEYPCLYFQIYKYKNDQRVLHNIKTSSISCDEKIRLLLYINDSTVIKEFANDFICKELTNDTIERLLSAKTVTASLIYFICTGLVSLTKPAFFIKALDSCLKIKDENKIKLIYEKYMNSVPQKAYNVFYTMCRTLKEYTVTNLNTKETYEEQPDNESLIMNPLITEHVKTNKSIAEEANTYKITENKSNTSLACTKLKLKAEDKMLHFICNVVIGIRKGEETEINFDPEKYGFFKMSDWMYEMLGHNQVTFE